MSSSPVQLAIVRQRYTPFGGAERFVSQALDALAGDQVNLSLYTRDWPRDNKVFEPHICDPFYLGSLWRDLGFAKAVCNAIRRDQPTLVQSHERIPCCDIFRAGDGLHRVWLEERKRHLNWWGRLSIDMNPAHYFRLRAEQTLFASSRLKAVICISQMIRSEILAHFAIDPGKLHVIYNAVDSATFSPELKCHRNSIRASFGIPDSAILFLFVGSGFARKGADQAIQAIAALPEHAHLLIVGKDKHLSRYKELGASHGLNRIHFAGAQIDVKPFYGAADVFVLPTLYDPLSNAVLEALACGLPVVTTYKCGAGEIVSSNSAGFLNNTNDIQALANNMSKLLNDEIRLSCAANARKAAEALTAAEMTSRLLKLYRSLIPKNINTYPPTAPNK